MKKFPLLCAAFSLFLIGCGEKSDTANPSAGSSTNNGSVLTAPADYLQAAGNAKKSAEKFTVGRDLKMVKGRGIDAKIKLLVNAYPRREGTTTSKCSSIGSMSM